MDHTMTKNPVSIPHFIWPADALRRAEKAAADSLGLTLFELMIRAGGSGFSAGASRTTLPASTG
ncbi:Nicotinamide nucleotide repair protein [Raoultella planticola]|uniref:Nicotinamide nucleotide repair protein n=1 Tax=Raoultella planticola TaxID=575 RepID=A0A485AM75_RAOPL|nr:Nicotinamide nucleotide repair protein [Raoultella planticola]